MIDLVQAEDEQAAKSQAPRLIEEKLVEILELFCKSQGIPHLSADELLHEELTTQQHDWVASFLDLWVANQPLTQ